MEADNVVLDRAAVIEVSLSVLLRRFEDKLNSTDRN